MTGAALARLADRPLFAPLAHWLDQIPDDAPPTLDQLERWRSELADPPSSGSGAPLRFVAADPRDVPYERRIFDTGCVPTRIDNWHDAFNALAWLRFPLAKAALNARHASQLRERAAGEGRGAPRDAATLFDESGVIVACADASLAQALVAHRWREVFVDRRGELAGSLRFVVFGHATCDQLRTPHIGLCGKALLLACSPEAFSAPNLYARLDADLAQRLGDPAFLATTAELSPLPLLGIPGVTPDSENPAYYDDLRQFRPARRAVPG